MVECGCLTILALLDRPAESIKRSRKTSEKELNLVKQTLNVSDKRETLMSKSGKSKRRAVAAQWPRRCVERHHMCLSVSSPPLRLFWVPPLCPSLVISQGPGMGPPTEGCPWASHCLTLPSLCSFCSRLNTIRGLRFNVINCRLIPRMAGVRIHTSWNSRLIMRKPTLECIHARILACGSSHQDFKHRTGCA